MGGKADVWQGTLALMVLKTIEMMGPMHGYGIARRIEQTSGNLLTLNYGTLYPALLKLEQEGAILSEWGVSENNRKAKFYSLTRAGRKQLESEAKNWEQTTAILARFLAAGERYERAAALLDAIGRDAFANATRACGREFEEEIESHLACMWRTICARG